MKRRKEVPAMPPGYMAALGKLYGKQPTGGPETGLESTQTTGVLQMMGDGISDTVSDGVSGNDDARYICSG